MNELSIIIPTYNEEKSLKLLCKKIRDVMNKIHISYEVIFVEDGSTDNSYNILLSLQETYPELKIIKLRQKSSQGRSLAIGIQYSSKDIIITLDSDLQDDPEDIPIFLNKMKNGYDFVCGWRKKRRDPYISKIIISKVGNFILSTISQIPLHDFSCTFKAYKKIVAKNISKKLYPGFHRFIPILGHKMNYTSFCEIETNHKPRIYGKSKYTFLKIFKALFDFVYMSFHFNNLKDLSKNNLKDYIETINL